MSVFTKGPVHKLPPDTVRYEIVYKIEKLEGWVVKRMWKTDKVGKEEQIGRALYERLKTKPYRFEIVMVRDIGHEVPVQTGSKTTVVTPGEYEILRSRERAKFQRSEIRERAKELGLWYPGMEEKFDA